MVIQTGFVRARKACFAGLLAAAAVIVPAASADIGGPGLSIYAWDNAGNRAQTAIEGVWDATHTTFTWSSSSTIELWDHSSDTLLGCLNPLENGQPTVSAFQYLEDPVVNLNFAVQAGAAASTTFMIASSLLTFPTISNAQGAASASFTVTDFANSGGASLNGQTGTGNAFGYLAQYNGFAGTQTGSTFAESIPTLNAPAGGTNTLSNNTPGVGYQAIAGSIGSISSAVKFTLSRFDLASGTTSFVVVPEPSSLLLIALGGLFATRRRG